MKLSEARYLITLRLEQFSLDPSLVGTRINLVADIDAAGEIKYEIREINPNHGFELRSGRTYAPAGWESGNLTIETTIMGFNVSISIKCYDTGAVRAVISDGGQVIGSVSGAFRAKPLPKPEIITFEQEQNLMSGQMFFMGAPNYHWAEVKPAIITSTLSAIRAAKLTGPAFEFGGRFIKDEYNKIKTSRSAEDIYIENIEAWAPWEAAIETAGAIAVIAFLNSNQSLANKLSDNTWYELAKRYARRYGSRRKLVLPLSESDSRCRVSIGDAIARGLIDGGFTRDQLISMARSWGKYNETHHGRGRVPTGRNFLTINQNDNGPSIADIYGPAWTTGGTPHVARIEEYASECREKHVSGGLYAFSESFDFVGCAAAGRGWRGASVATQDAVDLSMLKPGASEAEWKTWPIDCHLTKIVRVSDDTLRFTLEPRPKWEAVPGEPKKINASLSVFDADGRGGSFESTVTGDPARDVRRCEAIAGAAPGTVFYFVITAFVRHGKRTKSKGRSQVYKWVA